MLFAGGLAVLVLVAALAFDVGMMLVERCDEQNAADSAARPAPDTCSPTRPPPRRQREDIAKMNGFDDAATDEVVNNFIPPIHGRFVGFPGLIEVQIEEAARRSSAA